MARYRRRDQQEYSVADRLEAGGRRYAVELIAKKATGVEGYRLTLSYLETDGPDSAFVQLDPADTRDEVEDRARELSADPDRLRRLLAEQRGG
ncbi:MAG: hypothetical protein ACOC83_08915 [Gemmatimonadota bacterium]